MLWSLAIIINTTFLINQYMMSGIFEAAFRRSKHTFIHEAFSEGIASTNITYKQLVKYEKLEVKHWLICNISKDVWATLMSFQIHLTRNVSFGVDITEKCNPIKFKRTLSTPNVHIVLSNRNKSHKKCWVFIRWSVIHRNTTKTMVSAKYASKTPEHVYPC